MEESFLINREKSPTDWELLLEGKCPKDSRILERLTTGQEFLQDFLTEKYLKEYISAGGSKMKFVTGKPGSGKTHFMRRMKLDAEKTGFRTVFFSAKDVWLHDFREIYLEIIKQCDIDSLLVSCAGQIVRNMGYNPEEIGKDQTFLDYLSSKGNADAITKREIRNQLKEMFLDNPGMDNNFALAFALLTGSKLGHPLLESANREYLFQWLLCDKTVKLLNLRNLGLSPNRITKYNARNMLRSLTEVICAGSGSGRVVFIDERETLLDRSGLNPVHYTKLKREDTYESIRQLIDDIDTMNHIMFFFGFERALIDNENYGIKSYQALWMRIQNEISSDHFNRFSDILDLDRLNDQTLDENALLRISSVLAGIAMENGLKILPVDADRVKDIILRSDVTPRGLPGEIIWNTLYGGKEADEK